MEDFIFMLKNEALRDIFEAVFEEIETSLLTYSVPTFDCENKPIIRLNVGIYDMLAELKNKFLGD